jgi:protein involved in polysaccharide export with SLBB domain
MQKPGLIDYEPGLTVRDYMEKAGGYTYEANKGGARLIRARTGAREELDFKLIVGAGDEIWVPQKERVDYWSFFQSTMRTVAETLTLVVLVRSF